MQEWERQCLPATWLRWHVHAIDLSRRALAKAEVGVYSAWALRETSADLRERYFTTRGREHELGAHARTNVTFEQQNLLDESAPLAVTGAFDVIFCRNVLMYFTPEAARAVVARLTAALAPGGVLFLGHAESLRGLSSDYVLESSHGTFYYRLGQRPAVAPPVWEASEPLPSVAPVAPALLTEAASPASSGGALDGVRELVSLERFDQALEALALLSSPEHEEASVAILRAVAHLGNGDVEAAASDCNRLLAGGEGAVEAHVVLALVAEHRGDRREAIEHHRAALYLDPDFALAHLHLGRIQRREGRDRRGSARARPGARSPRARGDVAAPPLRRRLQPRGSRCALPDRARDPRRSHMIDVDIARRARMLAEAFDRSFTVPARVREDEGRSALALRVGGDPYLLLLEGLSGVAKRKRIVPLPGGAPAQLGLSGLRGGLVGVFSMPVLLGYEVALPRLAWLAVTGGPRPVALAFEELEGQVVVPPSSLAAVPPGARRHVAGLVRLDGEPSDRGLLDLGAMLARLAVPFDAAGV